MDFLARLFYYYPYRCSVCSHRFYESLKHQKAAKTPASSEPDIRPASTNAQRQQNRREVALYGSGLAVLLGFIYFFVRH